MPSLFTKQPAKGVYTLLTIIYTLARLPFLSLFYTIASNRQNRTWTFRQALTNELVRTFFRCISAVEVRTTETLDPGNERERFVVIKPAKDSLYRGILRETNIQPSVIGGAWYPRVPDKTSRVRREDVILHFHGGAYVIGNCRTRDCGFGAEALSKGTSRLVLCPQYRLSSASRNAFPAALQDAVTAFQFLLDEGFPASNIVISGDSAGANLAVALLRYIADTDGILPNPSAALLWSPWVNLSGDLTLYDRHRYASVDYLPLAFLEWGVRCLVAPSMDPSHPYVSPMLHPFATKTPLWIQVGAEEILTDDGELFAHQMERVQGNKVALCVTAHVPHDILLLGRILGFEGETHEAVRQAQRFIVQQKEL